LRERRHHGWEISLLGGTRFWHCCRPPQSAPKAEPDVDYGVLSGSSAFVAMMESAKFRERDDVALLWWLHPPGQRGIFFQPQMGPPAVIVGEITFKDAVQVNSVQHDYVVQTFTPDRTNQPFDVGRLPGRPGRDEDLLQTQSLGAMLELPTINAIPVPEKVLGW